MDALLIEAALKAVLRGPFILSTLQPSPTRPEFGGGWCGVFKWCREVAARGSANLETDTTLPGFDLFIVHVDADVADLSYGDGGDAVEKASLSMPLLPCTSPCPPAVTAADAIRTRIHAWLGFTGLGPKTVLCVPSKAPEAWLVSAVLDATHPLQKHVECNLGLETALRILPKDIRIKKSAVQYREHTSKLTENWARVTAACTQAARFEDEIRAVFP